MMGRTFELQEKLKASHFAHFSISVSRRNHVEFPRWLIGALETARRQRRGLGSRSRAPRIWLALQCEYHFGIWARTDYWYRRLNGMPQLPKGLI